jgi:uncharacterized repeat protein (TIGR01451 family)
MKTKLLFSLFFVLFMSFIGQAQIQLTACDTHYNGMQAFDLPTVIPMLLNGSEPSQYQFDFFISETNAIANTNPITNPNSYVNTSNPQLIWVRMVNNQTSEITINAFSLQVNPLPTMITEGATACDDNGDGIALFDLNEAIQITLGANNATPNTMSVLFYLTQADMENQTNPIGTVFENQFPNQTIYIRIDNLLTGCFWGGQFFLFAQDCTTSCVAPTNLSTTNNTETTAVLGWINATNATAYEIFVVPTGSPAPDANSQGIIANTNPYVLVGLTCNTSYTYYVKVYCNNQTVSEWSVGSTFMTSECGNTNIPYVTVNTSSFTTEQLLNNVILNSSCGVISNVITQGQCGVGYFNGNQTNFPFEQGMIIRSGQANFTEGFYSSGTSTSTCSQFTDPDLTAILQASGQTGSVNDVSSVKFNIVPTGNILSFNFIFASNEYGQYQCQFSDVFGFILTDLTTGQSQNIAIVPGTTTPISTTTIRDNMYNMSCASVNPQFFSTYNINNPLSVVNMAGYTVPMTAIASVIPNREYSLKLAVGDFGDTAFDSAVFIEGGSLALGNQCQDNIQLIAFLDSNNNGIKDSGEQNFVNGNFNYQVNNTGDVVSTISSNGVFYIFPENTTNTYDLSYAVYSEYAGYYAQPISYDDIVFSETESNVYFFPIVNTTSFNDVAVSIVATNQPTAGFTYQNKLIYTNNGIAPASGTLTFDKAPVLTITGISQTGTTPSANGFTFDYTDLLPLETRTINVSMSVPAIPTVAIGDLVTNSVSISTTTLDANSTNNSASLTRPIVASYDPNDKNEAHGKEIVLAQFSQDDYLYYTIRFQNTGTTNATFVRLEDVLDAQVDPESLRMISASHTYTLERVNNELMWKFDNIQLVPKLVNENASIGFVHFKIKPNAGYTVGTVIPNTAEIYFDFNPAIVTNTFETVFVENLSTPDFTNSELVLFPNPAKDLIQIQLKNGSDSIKGIIIYDVLGKEVYSKQNMNMEQTAIDISRYTKGVYIVEISTVNNQKVLQKFVKQ